jgi:hypothetical protein
MLQRRCLALGVVVLLLSGAWLGTVVSVRAVVVSSSGSSLVRQRTYVETGGALTPFWDVDFSNFSVLGGRPLQVRLLERLFSHELVQVVCPRIKVWIRNLDFTVNYSKVGDLPRLRGYTSFTLLLNRSLVMRVDNQAHSLVVHGFTGFLVFEGSGIRYVPGATRFGFVGVAKEVQFRLWEAPS